MTQDQITTMLAEIEQREQAATKGPWAEGTLFWTNIYRNDIERICSTQGTSNATANIAFIAHARTDVPALVALVRRLLVERDAAVSAIRALMTNEHISLSDQIYDVREREGLGWEGPSVKAWSDAVAQAQGILEHSTPS